MRRFWSARFLVAFLVILFTGAPSLASTLRWFCDGRVCGASLCCCEQPDPAKTDANCARIETSAPDESLCSSGCGCAPGISARDASDAVRPRISAPSAPTLFLIPSPATAIHAVVLRPIFHALPLYRGPPVAIPALPASGLRGPPASEKTTLVLV